MNLNPASALKRLRRFVKKQGLRLYAEHYIGRRERTRPDARGRIRVGFIVQMTQVWNKQAPVFEAMLEDDRFEPMLIVVPSYDFANGRLGEYAGELAYFRQKYGDGRILTTRQLGEGFEGIRGADFDYLFYQRCWETYLPRVLRSHNLVRYFRLCYIPYCLHLLKETESYYRTGFFANMYVTFTTSLEQKQCMLEYGCRRVAYEGTPALENLEGERPAARRRDGVTVLWTPRWREADECGGSSFFEYRDRLIEYAARHPEIRMVFRPHPLTLGNAVREKRMTEREVSAFREKCAANGVVLDANDCVDDSLREADVLLTDFSSIIPDAFMFGLPVVYLRGLPEWEPVEPFTTMLGQMYFPGDWPAVEARLDGLLAGRDDLRPRREQTIRAIREENHGSTRRILDWLAKGWR